MDCKICKNRRHIYDQVSKLWSPCPVCFRSIAVEQLLSQSPLNEELKKSILAGDLSKIPASSHIQKLHERFKANERPKRPVVFLASIDKLQLIEVGLLVAAASAGIPSFKVISFHECIEDYFNNPAIFHGYNKLRLLILRMGMETVNAGATIVMEALLLQSSYSLFYPVFLSRELSEESFLAKYRDFRELSKLYKILFVPV